MALHADQPFFPYDYPDTLSGLRVELAEAEQRRASHSRHPPRRRVNHVALRVDHPFGPDWAALLSVPKTILPSHQASSLGAAGEPSEGAEAESNAQGPAAKPAPAPPPPPVPVMQFGTLRGELAVRLTGLASQLPPIVTALMPRMLVRVALRFVGKGCSYAPATIHRPGAEQLHQWRHARQWSGAAVPPGNGKPVPAGALLGFVSNGGFSALRGRGIAVGFCSAAGFAELIKDDANPDRQGQALSGKTSGKGANQHAALVLVRNPSSRQFRAALASLRP